MGEWNKKQAEAAVERAKALEKLKQNGALATLHTTNEALISKKKTLQSKDNTLELIRKRRMKQNQQQQQQQLKRSPQTIQQPVGNMQGAYEKQKVKAESKNNTTASEGPRSIKSAAGMKYSNTTSLKLSHPDLQPNATAEDQVEDVKLIEGWEKVAGVEVDGMDAAGTWFYRHVSSGCVVSGEKYKKLYEAQVTKKKTLIDATAREQFKLPYGWKAIKKIPETPGETAKNTTTEDENSLEVYFWNVKTGKVQWLIPEE